MRVTLNNTRVIEIPDQSPTPRAIQDGDVLYILRTDNDYMAVPWYKTSGILINANGSIVLNRSE